MAEERFAVGSVVDRYVKLGMLANDIAGKVSMTIALGEGAEDTHNSASWFQTGSVTCRLTVRSSLASDRPVWLL